MIKIWKILILFILFLFTFLFVVESKQIASLSEIINPAQVLARDGKLYVLEKTTIHIYSLKDHKLIKTFGREGEGPGEFMARPFGPPMHLSFFDGKLVVNSNNKMSYFTLDGQFVREEKAPPNTVFIRKKKGYLGIGAALVQDNRPYICFRLFDSQFQNPRLLYQTEIDVGARPQRLVPMDALNYSWGSENRLYIVNGREGFVIDVFDFSGDRLSSIKNEKFKRIKVSENFRKNTLEWFKKSPLFREIFPLIKDRIIFKEYFPPIKTLLLDKNRMHVITNRKKGEKWECLSMDLKGKIKNKVYVPLQEPEPFTYYPLLCCVDQGQYFALIEDEDTETWELYQKKLR